jgi:hypothetical protein
MHSVFLSARLSEPEAIVPANGESEKFLLLPEMHRLLKPNGVLAAWTAFPWWSPASLIKSGLFAYVGKESEVHSFSKDQSIRNREGSFVDLA